MDKTKPAARACAGGSIKRGESRRSVAGLDKPPFCLRQRREGHSETIGAGVRWRPDEHERSELPKARIVPRGHAPRIDSPGTGWEAVRVWRN